MTRSFCAGALLALLAPAPGALGGPAADPPDPAPAKVSFARDVLPLFQQPCVGCHPRVYARPPVATSLDSSADGSLLAVSGYHEVLLYKADGSAVVGRLVGMSEQIQSLKFSPDGTLLAACGGSPGRFGEVQVWDV